MLCIKSVEYSHDSSVIAVVYFDEKVRLINTKNWSVYHELDCSQVSIKDKNTKIYKEETNSEGKSQLTLVNRANYKLHSVKPATS